MIYYSRLTVIVDYFGPKLDQVAHWGILSGRQSVENEKARVVVVAINAAKSILYTLMQLTAALDILLPKSPLADHVRSSTVR